LRTPNHTWSGTLVAREHAPACVEHIIENGCRFYGYDAFIVDGDTIQPVMESSPDWSEGTGSNKNKLWPPPKTIRLSPSAVREFKLFFV
jgi:hypothetical protein